MLQWHMQIYKLRWTKHCHSPCVFCARNDFVNYHYPVYAWNNPLFAINKDLGVVSFLSLRTPEATARENVKTCLTNCNGQNKDRRGWVWLRVFISGSLAQHLDVLLQIACFSPFETTAFQSIYYHCLQRIEYTLMKQGKKPRGTKLKREMSNLSRVLLELVLINELE